MDITATHFNGYAPALWSAKDTRLTWKTTLIVGVAAAALCLLGVALRRLYQAYWAVKDVSKASKHNLNVPNVDWDKIIPLKNPYLDDLECSQTALDLIKKTGVQETPYKQILIKPSRSNVSDPIFSNDGCFRLWNNPENYKGSEVLLIVFPDDKERSYNLNSNPDAFVARVKNGIRQNNPNIPIDIHVKILRHEDWHNGWFGKRSLSARAIECMTTDMHNLNIQTT